MVLDVNGQTPIRGEQATGEQASGEQASGEQATGEQATSERIVEVDSLHSKLSNLTVATPNHGIGRSALQVVELNGLLSKSSNLSI